jgi:hypothetical protein
MAHGPLLLPDLDGIQVHRLAQLCDERDATMGELDRGVLLEEPLVDPRGGIVGMKVVPNPAAAMLRALDKELDALADRLGLVPAARARLGLTLTSAERQAAELHQLMDSRFEERS